jgi:NAD(P)-dependent dehydrogenase (short-subunit alcohol dehydrogenase family)
MRKNLQTDVLVRVNGTITSGPDGQYQIGITSDDTSGMTAGVGESKQSIGPGLPADIDYKWFDRVAPIVPMRKREMFADPDAVAAVVAMLGSPEAFFVTGTEVRIDGGAHA